ncbi:MAG: hypothetical protein LQ343_001077 [Gyalolechia ehrenbergii]|nr:MAG: hypothetical protein LQ343_001077 [Gyalolechia ehrenbergii]
MARRLAGSAARDAFLDDAFDPSHIQTQRDAAEEYFNEMKNSITNNPDTREFETLIKDQKRRAAWFEEQMQRGRNELSIVEEAIQMNDDQAAEFLSITELYRTEIEGWQRKKEEGLAALEEDAQELIKLFQLRPQLAAVVIEDARLQDIIKEGLKRLESELDKAVDHIYGVEDALREVVMAKVDSWQLPQKLDEQIGKFQGLLDVSHARIEELEARAAEEQVQKEAKQEEIDRLTSQVTQLNNQVTERDTRITAFESQVSELRADCQTLENKISGLGRSERDIREELVTAEKQRDRYQGNVLELKVQLPKITKEHDDLLNRNASQSGRIEALDASLQEKTDDLIKMTHDRDSYRSQFSVETQNAQSLSDQLKDLRLSSSKEKEELEGRLRDQLEKQGQELASVTEHYSSLQRELASVTERYSSLERELASVNERYSSLERELDQSRSDRSSLREQLERANAETHALEVRCGTLSQELADVRATKQQADHAGQEAAVKITKERIESAGGSAR